VTTVLLIEDDDDLRLLVRLVLRPHADLELVAEAPSAEEAMALPLDLGPDVIVLDQHLGGGRFGLDAAPDLKARWPGTRIILYSAVDLTPLADRSAAVDRFVRKDDLGILVAALQELGRQPVAV
jgi:DNA-binding NarL/FixJ family response regulator